MPSYAVGEGLAFPASCDRCLRGNRRDRHALPELPSQAGGLVHPCGWHATQDPMPTTNPTHGGD